MGNDKNLNQEGPSHADISRIQQRLNGNLVQREVLLCQSSLIEENMKNCAEGFGIEDIENLTVPKTEEELAESFEDAWSHWEIIGKEYGSFQAYMLGQYSETPYAPGEWPLILKEEFPLSWWDWVERYDGISQDDYDGEFLQYLVEWEGVYEGDEEVINDQEVFEWWAVTDWLKGKLDEHLEPILDNNYGTWWGRTCTGQAILLDGVITQIQRSMDYGGNVFEVAQEDYDARQKE